MPETFIFDASAETEFYEKLGRFHNNFVYHLILNGVAQKGDALDAVKMTKNLTVSQKYCEHLIGGLTNISPSIIVKFTEDKRTRLECIFTHIYDNSMLNAMFMIQNVMDWPKLGSFSCQVWYLGSTSFSQIKEHWK